MPSKSIHSFIVKLFLLFTLISFSYNKATGQAHVDMKMEWISSTDSTADFDILLSNTGTIPLKFNCIIFKGTHLNTLDLLQGGIGVISWRCIQNTSECNWNNWPSYSLNLPYPSNGNPANLLLYTSTTVYFTSLNAPQIPTCGKIKVARFQVKVSGGKWNLNSQFGFTFIQSQTYGVAAYLNGATLTTTLSPISGNLTSMVPSNQFLNSTIFSSVLSGYNHINLGSSSLLELNVNAGVSPYSVVVADGSGNTISVNGVSPISIPVSPTSTTTYSIVSVSDALGNLSLYNYGNPIICIDNNLINSNSNISACNAYTWSSNNQTYSTSGIYTNVSNCGVDTLNLSITNGINTTQTVSAINTYTWALNNQTYTNSGLYSYINGCDTTMLDLTINFPLSTNSLQIANDFAIYPNPTNKEVLVEFDLKNGSNYSIKINDVSGRTIKEIANIHQSKLNINLSNVDAGIYFIQLIENNKIIKTKQIRKE